jgi:hypothetical protein
MPHPNPDNREEAPVTLNHQEALPFPLTLSIQSVRETGAISAARVPKIIKELKAYTIQTANDWVQKNVRKSKDSIVQNQKFTNYQRDIVDVFDKIKTQITSGFDACCTNVPTAIDNTHANALGRWWHGEVIRFDHTQYFAKPASRPMGHSLWYQTSQAATLLHELSHMAASTEDLNWTWVPGTAPGNPTNIAFTRNYKPSLAATDAFFLETLQEHTATNVDESWILPYLYEK